MATIKHFIANEQEMWRQYNIIQPAYSANIGELLVSFHLLYDTNLLSTR